WLSAAVRRRIADDLPGGEADGRTLAVWLAGVHDIGKATPAFAIQASALAERMRDRGLVFDRDLVRADRRYAPHAAAGHVVLADWLLGRDWPDPHPYAVVGGGHHALPPTDHGLRQVMVGPPRLGDQAW